MWNNIPLGPDEFLGKVTIKGGVKHSRQTYPLRLTGNKKGSDDASEDGPGKIDKKVQPGKVTIDIKHYSDMGDA